jgi:hypothetical protein
MCVDLVFKLTPCTKATKHIDIHKDVYRVAQKSLDPRGNMLNF